MREEQALESGVLRAGGNPGPALRPCVPLPVHRHRGTRRSYRGRVVDVRDAERATAAAVITPRRARRPTIWFECPEMAIAREAETVGSLAEVRRRASTARISSASTATCSSRAASRSAATSSTSGREPRLVLHRSGERGRCGRRGDGDGTRGHRHTAPARHGRARDAGRRALAVFAQNMGLSGGPTGGKDGVHMADANLGLIAMVSRLPAMLPVAVGCALAFRIREERRVAVGWFGEGASAGGDCHEAMNLAGVGACLWCSSATTTSGRLLASASGVPRSSSSPIAPRRTGSTG